ncbi:GNAT family N-acetyltransferase [Halobacillus karajensis]|nr:GNAT family protein [Halobacillus karajensis]
MTQKEAEAIARWKYKKPFDFYDMTADEEDYELFINPEKRSPHTYSGKVEGNLIGFLTVEPQGNRRVDLGLGLHPDHTGKGEGEPFMEACLAMAKKEYKAERFTLSVATFNQRAITVYERAGFIRKGTFMQSTNGGSYEFLKMEKYEKGET